MKKTLYLAFIAALALSMGCVVTNYPVVTDVDLDSDAFYVVNTSGKALINETYPVIGFLPDGTYAQAFHMIDQKFDGSGTITSYTAWANPYYGGFIGSTYCDPNWTGCAFATAENQTANLWAYTLNPNCEGYRAGIAYLYSYDNRIGECGRGLVSRVGPGMANAITGSLVDLGDAWGWNLNRSNTRLIGQDPQGHSFEMPLFGNTRLEFQKDGEGLILRHHSGMLPTARAQSRVTEEYGVAQWTLEYLGHSRTFNAKLRSAYVAETAGW